MISTPKTDSIVKPYIGNDNQDQIWEEADKLLDHARVLETLLRELLYSVEKYAEWNGPSTNEFAGADYNMKAEAIDERLDFNCLRAKKYLDT